MIARPRLLLFLALAATRCSTTSNEGPWSPGASGGQDGGGDAVVDSGAVDSVPRDVVLLDPALVANLLKVAPTGGCGEDPGMEAGATVRGTLQTTGRKPSDCADKVCGDWSYEREYFVKLPALYDRTRAYPLVFLAPGCGSTGNSTYGWLNSADNTIIRVGLTPPPDTIGHATNPGQHCFDDMEGDDSVDFVFYEVLFDKLATQLCFDRNRVFASGLGSGARLSMELGCRYAGDARHPIRATLTTDGSLPTGQPKAMPTCTGAPLAALWIWHADAFLAEPGITPESAIAQAMIVDQCAVGTGVNDALTQTFPLGAGNTDTACKRILGCPNQFPLVMCPRRGAQQTSLEDTATPGFAAFVKLLAAPALSSP